MMSNEEVKAFKEEFKQLRPMIIGQMLISVALIFLTIVFGCYLPLFSVPNSNQFSDKLIYTIRHCGLPCALVMLVAINNVDSKRGSTPAVDPLAGKEHYVQLEKNVLTNSVEQLLVFLLITLVLITYLDYKEMKIVPIYMVLFVIGRILFHFGYKIKHKFHLWRTCGMFVNFGSACVMIVMIVYFTFTRG